MWWPEPLRAGLGGECVYLATGAARAASGAVAAGVVPTPARPELPPWRPALDALAAQLPEARRRVDLVLSSAHVRWKLLDLPRGLRAGSERDALAMHLFRDSLGAEAGHWRVEVVDQPAGWPAPACAIDARLIDAFAAACTARRLRPGRIRPYLAAAFDYWRWRLPGDSFWFAVADGDGISLALLGEGRWRGLNTRAALPDRPAQIASMQAQLAIPAGIDAAALPLYLVAPDAQAANDAQRLSPPDDWQDSARRCRLAWGI